VLHAATSSDDGALKNCVAVRHSLRTFPLDQLNMLRIDSELRLLALHATKVDNVGASMARSVATEIQSLPNSQLRGSFNSRLAPSYIRLNGGEAVEWLASLPSKKKKEQTYNDYKAEAYSQAIGASQGMPAFQMELVRQGLGSGAFEISQLPVLLQKQDRSTAIALYRLAIAAFPLDWPSDRDVWTLFRLTQIAVSSSVEDARTGVSIMLAAFGSPNYQTNSQRTLPEFLSAQMDDQHSPLKSQVERMAMLLHVTDEIGDSTPVPLFHVMSPSASPTAVNAANRSMEFQSANMMLTDFTSDEDILRMASSIKSRGDRAQFFLTVLQDRQDKPGSIIRLAQSILDSAEGNDDPQISLAIPAAVLHAAVLMNDSSAGQLALASFARGAFNACSDTHLEEDGGFVHASVCIREYNQIVKDIASSRLRKNLQATDPSFLQRLELDDVESCGPSSSSSRMSQ
jgi:hypothetical protein